MSLHRNGVLILFCSNVWKATPDITSNKVAFAFFICCYAVSIFRKFYWLEYTARAMRARFFLM